MLFILQILLSAIEGERDFTTHADYVAEFLKAYGSSEDEKACESFPPIWPHLLGMRVG